VVRPGGPDCMPISRWPVGKAKREMRVTIERRVVKPTRRICLVNAARQLRGDAIARSPNSMPGCFRGSE